MIVAGAFTQVCEPGPASSGHCAVGTTVTREDIFAYQLGTGTTDPKLSNDPVYDGRHGSHRVPRQREQLPGVHGAETTILQQPWP